MRVFTSAKPTRLLLGHSRCSSLLVILTLACWHAAKHMPCVGWPCYVWDLQWAQRTYQILCLGLMFAPAGAGAE